MLVECMDIILGLFTQLFLIFETVYTSLNMWGLVLGLITIYTAYRFLIKPIIGGSGSSDSVKKRREE